MSDPTLFRVRQELRLDRLAIAAICGGLAPDTPTAIKQLGFVRDGARQMVKAMNSRRKSHKRDMLNRIAVIADRAIADLEFGRGKNAWLSALTAMSKCPMATSGPRSST